MRGLSLHFLTKPASTSLNQPKLMGLTLLGQGSHHIQSRVAEATDFWLGHFPFFWLGRLHEQLTMCTADLLGAASCPFGWGWQPQGSSSSWLTASKLPSGHWIQPLWIRYSETQSSDLL